MHNQSGFISLFVLIPVIIIATVVVTLSVPKLLSGDNRLELSSISKQIEQKETEIEAITGSASQEAPNQELVKLKIELEDLKNSQATKTPIPKTQISTTTNTPAGTLTSNQNLKIELSASRYSLPANGQAVAFITAQVLSLSGKIDESFSGIIEFQTTAGVLIPAKVSAQNGSAYTELQASTVPTNLTITAQSGDIKSNSINLSFSSVPSSTPTGIKLNVSSSDLEAVVALRCDSSGGDGSGVIFTPDGKILTNYHVTKGNPCDVYISPSFNQEAVMKYRAGIITSNQSLDVSILQIAGDANYKYVSGLNIPYLKPGPNSDTQIGDEVRLLGYPDFGGLQNKPTLTQGVTSGEEGSYIKTDVKSSAGSSGGPVIDNSKSLVGIWVGIYLGSNDNIGRFLKIDVIRQWWLQL